jgi:hypothetical protein
MKKKLPIEIARDFNVKTIATVQELRYHDMIYTYHLLQPGDPVTLIADGTNLKGDIRYKVMYFHFTLGYVTLGGYFKSHYETSPELAGTIISLNKEKFSMIRDMDIEIDVLRLRNVS